MAAHFREKWFGSRQLEITETVPLRLCYILKEQQAKAQISYVDRLACKAFLHTYILWVAGQKKGKQHRLC